MKKYLLILCAVFALTSCAKEDSKTEKITPQTRLEFSVTVKQAPTKSVKTAFVTGDVIYLFFNNVAISATPKYATITFDGTKWNGVLQGGLTVGELATTGATMSAVYFPFGTVNITTSGESYVFKGADDLPIYTYFSSATAPYELKTAGEIATLTASLNMVIPDNYVQFFVDKDGSNYATNWKYRLVAKDIRPAACGSYTPAGGFAIKALDYTQPLWGYVYNNEGIMFSGQINATNWASASERRFVFFETGAPAKSATISNTLVSHSSINIKNVASWPAAVTVPGGVDMGLYKNNDPATGKLLLWADRNLGATATGTTDYGFYLAWGEIVPDLYTASTWQMKTDIRNTNYYWYDATLNDNFKYPNSGDVLEPQDDAATAYLGNGWRTPTKEELQALYSLEKTNSSGWTFTATNGNSIFIPLGGRISTYVFYGVGGWTNIISSTKATSPLIWYSYEGSVDSENGQCWIGQPVRPVKEVQAISNLIHYWPFNGNTNDAVTSGTINATNYGATLTTDRFGNANKAYSFDGVDDKMNIYPAGNFDDATSFTFNAWVNTTGTGGSANIIRTENGNGSWGWFVRFLGNGKIQIWEGTYYNYTVESANAYNDGNWHMVTFVRDVINLRGTLYVDGNAVCNYTMSNGAQTLTPSWENNYHYLGSYGDGEFFGGKMDEVRLYNKALTAEEVAALYQY